MWKQNLPRLAIAVALIAAALPHSAAQTRPSQDVAPVAIEPPLSETQRLERLFERLKAAPDANAAKVAAERIERSFEKSGSDTADLLLQRVKQSIEAKEFGSALDLLDYIITLRPDWAEGYHRRAVVHFLLKDTEAAMRDVRATLAREPRHWHALAGLGALLRQTGNAKAAYRAYRAAIEIHPHFDDLKETLDKMKPEIEGNPV